MPTCASPLNTSFSACLDGLGLSNIITRNQADDAEVLQSVPDNPNLKVLCAGVTPPAPGGLLSFSADENPDPEPASAVRPDHY